VLRACAELLRRGGRIAFLTIEPALNLSAVQMQRAIKNGPPEVAVEAPHEQLLASAGLTNIDVFDVTAEFSRTQQGWIDAWLSREAELHDLLGDEVANETKSDRLAMRSAIDEGLLRRTLYLARRPNRP
jgi:hypothetical protein